MGGHLGKGPTLPFQRAFTVARSIRTPLPQGAFLSPLASSARPTVPARKRSRRRQGTGSLAATGGPTGSVRRGGGGGGGVVRCQWRDPRKCPVGRNNARKAGQGSFRPSPSVPTNGSVPGRPPKKQRRPIAWADAHDMHFAAGARLHATVPSAKADGSHSVRWGPYKKINFQRRHCAFSSVSSPRERATGHRGPAAAGVACSLGVTAQSRSTP